MYSFLFVFDLLTLIGIILLFFLIRSFNPLITEADREIPEMDEEDVEIVSSDLQGKQMYNVREFRERMNTMRDGMETEFVDGVPLIDIPPMIVETNEAPSGVEIITEEYERFVDQAFNRRI